MRLPTPDPKAWAALKARDPVAYDEAYRDLQELYEIFEVNPLAFFEPHDRTPDQRNFLEARSHVIAAFAGNRFGKTTALVVKAFAQHVPKDKLGELAPFRVTETTGAVGRLLCPSEQVMFDVLIPEMQKWAPKYHLQGGSWESAWDKQHNILRFVDGGRIGVYTYKQDPDTMEGSSLDYVGYDEPPPEPVRNACMSRLADRDGFEMFAMTPVNMKGSGIGWIYRKIWKQRENPDVTVVRGSGFDNPTIPREALERILAGFPEEERRAREFGEFMHFGGMVYPGGFESSLSDPPAPSQLDGHDIVVGIDPGLKCAAFVWVGFDNDNRAVVFDEAVVLEGTPIDWAKAIRAGNTKWGVEPIYVIDPSARNRSLVNAESVEAEFQRQGIYPIHGQNQVFAGVSQVRRRLQEKGLFVSRECRGLRDEAEEYRQQDRDDEEFAVVKENDHRLDALRYALMSRPWYSTAQLSPDRLGWIPGSAPAADWFAGRAPVEAPPMGSFS